MKLRKYHNIQFLLAAFLSVAALASTTFADTEILVEDGEWLALDAALPVQYVDVIVPYNGYLYIGGKFDFVGDQKVNYIARFDGTNWEPLATGIGRARMGLVHAIVIHDDILYCGGMFDQVGLMAVGNCAMFDLKTEQWLPMASGFNNAVRDMAVGPNGEIYAGGEFKETGDGMPMRGFAVWDGFDWSAVGGSLGGMRARLRDIDVNGNDVYVGGYFPIVGTGGLEANHIARWDGEKWHALYEGIGYEESRLEPYVSAVAFYDGFLYVGGQFNRAGQAGANGVARWIPGVGWDTLGRGIRGTNSHIRTFYSDGKNLFIGGTFTEVGNDYTKYVARWDGHQWHPMGSPLNNQVKTIIPYNNTLYIGGNFIGPNETAMYIATWGEPQIDEPETPAPVSFALNQNFPNPFNPTTTISFSLAAPSAVQLGVYDVGGRLVRTLANGVHDAGAHEIQWDGRNANGAPVSTGVYLYRLTSSTETLTRKMILLK